MIRLLLACLLPILAFAQPQGPDTLWTRVHPLPDIAYFTVGDALALPDGGTLVCARVTGIETAPQAGLYLFRLDSSGNLLWRRACGDSLLHMTTSAMCQIAPNRFAVVGWWYGPTLDQLYTVLVDSLGETLSDHLYVWPTGQILPQTCPSGDGGFLVVYKSINLHGGSESIGWMKLDSDSDSLWAGSMNIPGYRIWPSAVIPSPDGGYAIAGKTGVAGQGSVALLIKLNAFGGMEFYRTFDYQDADVANDVLALANGDFVLCGRTTALVMENPDDTFILRVSATGDSIATWIDPELRAVGASRILGTADGGFVVHQNIGTGGSDYAPELLKFNDRGELQWRHSYPLPSSAYTFYVQRGVVQNGDGRFTLVDMCTENSTEDELLAAIKTQPEVASTGTSPPELLPENLGLSTSPNPFNATTQIRYTLPHAAHVSLRVYDVMGREVGVLEKGMRRAGEHRAVWEAEGMASGVYFIRLRAGAEGMTRKVLLVR